MIPVNRKDIEEMQSKREKIASDETPTAGEFYVEQVAAEKAVAEACQGERDLDYDEVHRKTSIDI
jgi:hypothetical protein